MAGEGSRRLKGGGSAADRVIKNQVLRGPDFLHKLRAEFRPSLREFSR